jgi:Mg2+ and Co2+ transporter CorA
MSAVLEAFSFNNEINFKDLNETILNYVPKKFIWEIRVTELNQIIGKMIRLGFIEPIKTNNEYNPKFKITIKGIETIQQQTYQSLASSSFFNYQTFQLSKRANKMNVLMLIVTIMSVIVTLMTIFK